MQNKLSFLFFFFIIAILETTLQKQADKLFISLFNCVKKAYNLFYKHRATSLYTLYAFQPTGSINLFMPVVTINRINSLSQFWSCQYLNSIFNNFKMFNK